MISARFTYDLGGFLLMAAGTLPHRYVQQYLAPLIPALAKEGSGAAAAKPAKGKKAKKE